jgi:hypothetical protein
MKLWPPAHRTVEDYRGTALRELYRHHVFDHPVGSVWCDCALTWAWLRSFRLGSACLELELRNGRWVIVPRLNTPHSPQTNSIYAETFSRGGP